MGLLIVVLASLMFVTGCHKEKPPEPSLQTVRAGTVEEFRPETPDRYAATIAPSSQVDLAFKSAGLVDSIHQVRGADGRVRNVQSGDKVAQGVELATVRKVDYQQRVQQAQDQTGQAEAQLAQARAGLSQAELDFSRASNLYQSASLTKPEYDQAKSRLDASKAQVDAAKAAVATARTVVSQADLTLADTSLRAPFTGWITARNVERGSLVGSATPGFSMMDTSYVKAIFAVPDSALRTVKIGQRLPVSLEVLQRPATGTVTSIAPQADPKTRVFSVEVSIPNPRDEIRPGMIGSVTLGQPRESNPRTVVPLGAVVRAPGNPNGFALYRLENRGGKTYAAVRIITIGDTVGNSIEVRSGIAAGERIVALGGELLHDGQEVRVLP